MAAYAALVSVMYIIEQIQHHPRPPIFLDKKQVESLTENVTFLQDFLEAYNYHIRDDGLESRIADAAHAAEDVIESHIVDRILDQSTSHGENIHSNDLFYQDLQKVIQGMDFIKKEVMEIKEKMGSVQDHLHKRSSMPEATTSRMSSSTILGLDDKVNGLMDKLTGHRSSDRQIIPIVGMGGMGKTTLARKVYEHPVIVEHFDVRAWATISQEYSAREILSQLFDPEKQGGHEKQGGQESASLLSEQELGEMLHKKLWGRRYLIIMDDMWSIKAWEKVKFLLPNEKNGSGIIITSRISNVAEQLTGDHGLRMNFLNEEVSWSLLCKIVFGEGVCPLELEATGKKIAENCKGLPLSLVVIGGLLAKSNRTREYWEYIAENLNSIVNLENNAHCLNLLYLSYNHLPVHLKSCFLYFGVFSEDRHIFVPDLINLWVAEGFLKPISGKSLEEVAEEYFKELLDRNLIFISRTYFGGKVFSCKIHDLLRDLCLREAEKEKFLCVTKQHSHNTFPHGLNTQRRIALHHNTSGEEFLTSLHSASNARSLIFNFEGVLPWLNFRLLRLLQMRGRHPLEANFFELVNLRFIFLSIMGPMEMMHPRVPSSFYLLWNLHTLVLGGVEKVILDIWKMPQLRHVDIWPYCYLSKSAESLMDGQGDFILKNLQFLSMVKNFRCSKKMVKRILNIKILRIGYEMKRFIGSHFCLDNLVLLEKLEELSFEFWGPSMEPINRSNLLHNIRFPHFLKELILSGSRLHWEDISTKISSLPHLQVLSLQQNSVVGPEWETSEGQFCSLKFLQICGCCDLECWKTDDTHFPCLEQLVLLKLQKLKEIPQSIGDITTLQSIMIHDCSDSVIFSAKEIHKEQEEAGNEGLRVEVEISGHNEEVESLASHNFSVKVRS